MPLWPFSDVFRIPSHPDRSDSMFSRMHAYWISKLLNKQAIYCSPSLADPFGGLPSPDYYMVLSLNHVFWGIALDLTVQVETFYSGSSLCVVRFPIMNQFPLAQFGRTITASRPPSWIRKGGLIHSVLAAPPPSLRSSQVSPFESIVHYHEVLPW